MKFPLFTEGPWRAAQDPTEPKLHCIWTDEEGVDQMSILVARTCFAPQSESNAMLLAASTVLYEALEMVRDADDDCIKDGLPHMPPAARAKIDAAISKAIGT